MGVLTDLVVAPLEDADAVANVDSSERPWPWCDAKGLGFEEVAALHCILDGLDPDTPVEPPAWMENPFTKQNIAVTTIVRYVEGFESAGDSDDSEVVLMRAPADFVHRVAQLDEVALHDLARRWTEYEAREAVRGRKMRTLEESAEYLNHLADMSRTAHQRGHELYVWISP